MKASFDFDGVLTNEGVQDFARQLIEDGVNVYILTQRPPVLCKEVFNVASRIGVNIDHVVFAGVQPKEDFLEDIEPMFHLDDDPTIDSERLVVYSEGWKYFCEERLRLYDLLLQPPNTLVLGGKKHLITESSLWNWLHQVNSRVDYYEWKQIELMIRNR